MILDVKDINHKKKPFNISENDKLFPFDIPLKNKDLRQYSSNLKNTFGERNNSMNKSEIEERKSKQVKPISKNERIDTGVRSFINLKKNTAGFYGMQPPPTK